MQYKQRIKRIKHILQERKYFLIFICIAIAYTLLSLYLINSFFAGIENFLNYDKLWYVLLNFAAIAIVSFLLGLNIALNIHRFNEMKTISKYSTIGIFGSFFSFLGIGCPSCSLSIASTLIPSLGSFIVIGSLPLKGLEIQILSIAILLLSLYFVTKENTCKIELKK